MAKSIDSLLKKKGWSGDEVGKALVASAVHDFKHQKDPDYKPLFTQADFDKMESSLNTDRDYLIYGCYRDIYSSIIDTFNRGQALFQQFYNGYSRYSNAMILCNTAENALKQAEDYPLIMTESQYKRHKRKTKERLKGFTESYITLVFKTIEYFYNAPELAPEAIKRALDAISTEPATNKRLLAMYNEVMGLGYYTLPDGRKSKDMSLEEWQKTLEELYLDSHHLTIDGEPATAEETLKHYREQTILKTYKLFFEGIEGIKRAYKEVVGEDMEVDEVEETRLLKALEDMLGAGASWEVDRRDKAQAPLYPLQGLLRHLADQTETITEWHYNENPPEDITKDFFLEDILEEWYSGILSEDAKEAQATLEEFIADYPELYKAVVAYIEEKIPALKGLKPAHKFDDITSWGNLAELDYLNYKSLIEPSEADIVESLAEEAEDTGDTLGLFSKRVRIVWNSIAIVQNPRKSQLDANGDYKENANALLAHFSNLDTTAETEQETGELEAYRNVLFIPALRYIYAFNALMGIVGTIYDIDGMDTLKLPTASIETQLGGFNNLLYMFYADVTGDPAERTRKRELIKQLFAPVDVEELKPAQEAIDAVTKQIAELGYTTKARKQLKDFDRFIFLLQGEGA